MFVHNHDGFSGSGSQRVRTTFEQSLQQESGWFFLARMARRDEPVALQPLTNVGTGFLVLAGSEVFYSTEVRLAQSRQVWG